MTRKQLFRRSSGTALRRASSAALILAAAWLSPCGGQTTNAPPKVGLTRSQPLQLVLERNETIQLRVLELEITRKRYNAERGVFEPDLVLSASREENKRENTAEQRRSLRINTFEEKNNVYNSGIEALVPSGAKVRLAYTMRDLNNNLQDPRLAPGTIRTNSGKIDEFQTFAGLTVTQPLLKNFGFAATMANIRLAALASDIAYQEYRRQLMETVATAEAAYWNLFMAQEQVKFFRDSVALAETIVRDNRVRAEAGKGSDLEVLEAEAGLALRLTRLADAEQKRQEAEMRVLTLYSDSALSAHPIVEAVDQPSVDRAVPEFLASAETAFALNPDYRAQQKKIGQEDIRLAYAKNQRLPQLDLHASYGLNGLGDTPAASHEDLEKQSFPSFSIGLELRMPLGGGIKSRNELEAAKLRKQQSLLSLKQIETQIINAVQAAVQKIRSARDSVDSNQKVVSFYRNLLDTQMERLDVGKVESRKVLETEAALFESRNAVLDAIVQYERARLELELVQGLTLKARDLDLSQVELQERTAALLEQRYRHDTRFDEFMRSLYATPPAPTFEMRAPTPEELENAHRILREKLDQLQRQPPSPTPPSAELPPPSPGAGDMENVRRALRDALDGVKTTPPKSE